MFDRLVLKNFDSSTTGRTIAVERTFFYPKTYDRLHKRLFDINKLALNHPGYMLSPHSGLRKSDY